MAKISSTTSVMEAYYKLTQTPSQMEEELKQELKNLTSDTSSLDDLTDLVGALKNEVQFLNKAKDAKGQGDEILEQFYLQHAEHYYRQIDNSSKTSTIACN